MLYELLSPSIELEIDRALDCSPMPVSTANPILRRLGVAGGEGKGHFNGGRFGNSPEDAEDEA